MADERQFGKKPGTPGSAMRCEEWEALLTDALDGLLPAGKAAAFAAHAESCENCGDLLAHVKQGQEWLTYLHEEPEIPSGLVAKIVEKTLGAGGVPIPVVAAGVPATAGGAVAMAMPWRRSFHETRLLMTVAMAFFSLALTLNIITGGHLTSLKLADLTPSQIGSTLSREFYGARGSVVKYYDNMRLFYRLQTRMRELRRDVEQPQQQQNNQQQNQQQKPSGRTGGSASVQQGTGLRAQVTGQRSAFSARRSGELQRSVLSVQRSGELQRSAFGDWRSEELQRSVGSGEQTEQKQEAAVVVLKSDQTGTSISLGRSETGLRQTNVERGLV
ncbi:MAG TPA: zf-HC2 domain-containing protein [Acidobacteriaceae bacterium]|nr:zf-HC2 domain-containing protein [Acidobacteriaceae bacterium]